MVFLSFGSGRTNDAGFGDNRSSSVSSSKSTAIHSGPGILILFLRSFSGTSSSLVKAEDASSGVQANTRDDSPTSIILSMFEFALAKLVSLDCCPFVALVSICCSCSSSSPPSTFVGNNARFAPSSSQTAPGRIH